MSEVVFLCNRCGNEDPAFFYNGERGWYCRKCIKFGDAGIIENDIKTIDSEYKLRFNLTDRQKKISSELTQRVREGKSVLLEAVCGAGKTEIIFEMISDQMATGHRVGFAIARRQVVLEIADRLKEAFTHLKVIAVCQGHTQDVIGDLIVCTTHQLYRYTGYFDVLVIDEPDAFPFKGNDVLKGIASRSCRRSTVYLTATPDNELKDRVINDELSYLYLSKRPHGNDLCVPEVFCGSDLSIGIYGFVWLCRLLNSGKRVLLFVPSRKTGVLFYTVLKHFFKTCNVSSLTENKDEIIGAFKKGEYDLCITTSILERGITIPDVQVLVWKADNGVFDEAALTQISGRVGRSPLAPRGECLFLTNTRNRNVDSCIKEIVRANND